MVCYRVWAYSNPPNTARNTASTRPQHPNFSSTETSSPSALFTDIRFIRFIRFILLYLLRLLLPPCSATETTLDFGPTTSALAHFVSGEREASMFSMNGQNALLGLVQRGVPRLQVNEVDAKKGMEAALKSACQSFIEMMVKDTVGGVVAYTVRR